MDNLARETSAKEVLEKQIIESVKTGFIDSSYESLEMYRPKLIYNDCDKGNTVLANITKELEECDSFWFLVAFITKSGLVVLKETLKEISEKGVHGRILTTDYLAFNEPGALRELLKFSNIEVKIFTKEHFHTKG